MDTVLSPELLENYLIRELWIISSPLPRILLTFHRLITTEKLLSIKEFLHSSLVQGFVEKTGNILAEKEEKRKKINCSRLVSRLSLQDNFRHAHRLPRARTYTRTNYPKRHIRSRNAPLTIFRREDPSTLLFNRRGGENGKAGRFSRWSNNKTIS